MSVAPRRSTEGSSALGRTMHCIDRVPARALRVTMVATIVACATQGFAQDRADLDRTQIIGNRELPKVLYIVPWKKPLSGDLTGRPATSVLDEVLGPVDRDVFRRQVRYDSMTQAQSPASATK